MNSLRSVVIVSNVCTPGGGASQVAYDEALGLSFEGISVYFFCGAGPVDAKLVEAGVNVTCLEASSYLERPNKIKALLSGLYDRNVYVRFEQLLATLDPLSTVVHFHSWQHCLSCSPIDCAARNSFPVVITAHEYSSVCPNMALFNFNKMKKCTYEPMRLSCLCSNCDKRGYVQKLYRFAREVILRKTMRRANPTLIYISEFSRSVLESKPAHKDVVGTAEYLPDAVTGSWAEYDQDNNIQGDYYALIGRLSPEKGPALFCEAVQSARVNGIVVGDGELKEELEAKYPDIRFTGWLDKSGVAAIRSNARGLVFPSRWFETAGLSSLEAMMFDAVPCIVSDGCATREYIDDGVTGLLFKDGDIEDLCSCIKKLDNDEFAEQVRRNIRRRDFSEFALESHTSKLLCIYKRAINRSDD